MNVKVPTAFAAAQTGDQNHRSSSHLQLMTCLSEIQKINAHSLIKTHHI